MAKGSRSIDVALAKLNTPLDRVDDLADEPNSIYDFQPSHITRLLASYGIDWQAALKEYFITIHDWFSLVRHDKFDSFYHISSSTDDYNGLPIPNRVKM